MTTLSSTGDLRSLVPSVGSATAAADVVCTEVADARLLNGTWRAFLSTGTENAPSRMIGNGPWVNLDGGTVFLNRSALTLGLAAGGGEVTFETGEPTVGTRYFWSGTTSTGQASATRCSDWTSTSGQGTAGTVSGFTVVWDSQTPDLCTSGRRLLCLEQDLPPLRLSPRPTTPRRLFVTSLTFNGNLGGLSGADTLCQNVAGARTLGGTWRALVATSTIRPGERALRDGPFTLLDGGVVFPNRAALTFGLPTTLAITNELGVPVSNALFWSGASATGGASAQTCSSWTSQSGSVTGAIGDTGTTTQRFSWNGGTDTCVTQRRLLCVED
ncbi:MAG: hypothetical protein JNJ54_33155 [Myxococcaceae bacterium]|nr:hypothetical protein [Myxococcaceae bacterium]